MGHLKNYNSLRAAGKGGSWAGTMFGEGSMCQTTSTRTPRFSHSNTVLQQFCSVILKQTNDRPATPPSYLNTDAGSPPSTRVEIGFMRSIVSLVGNNLSSDTDKNNNEAVTQ